MSTVYWQHVVAKARRERDEAIDELAAVRDQLATLNRRLEDPANVSPLRRLGRVTRLVVIDDEGSAYVADGVTVTAAIQDDGHTLKVYVR